jgi:hypothetical protein
MLDMPATPSASAASAASSLPIYASLFDDGDVAQSATTILSPISTTREAPVPRSERGAPGWCGERTLGAVMICPAYALNVGEWVRIAPA